LNMKVFIGLAVVFLFLGTTHGIPQGIAHWFRSTTCPDGWQEFASTKGRLIVSVSDGMLGGLTVNDALANLEDRTHSHEIESQVTLDTKSVSAIGCCNPDGACHGTYPLNGSTTNDASGMPFVQLVLCSFSGPSTTDPIPYGTIAFFDSTVGYDSCSDIPGNWQVIESVVGRSIIPGYSTGLFTSTSAALTSQEDRPHQHVFTATINPNDQEYAGITGCCDDKLAEDKPYVVTDSTDAESSHIPYIQLLTCVSQNETFDSGLPDDAYIFTEVNCPSGYRLNDLLSGRYIVSNPENGTPGASFGGVSLPAQTLVGNNHSHTFNTELDTNSCEIGLASGCCGSGYVKNQKYTQGGVTEEAGVDFPFISVPICERE